ncbi:hypothetical protein [Marinobacter sp. HL-58]|uniref:hypothetical protein n=1 Tax=Marinobacter sp. HL-58 TaxID=1479237 RepID=UPI0004879E50|nr:hypothetical protein [Marinobacter sp. HL-58]KPP97804.1 MAG: Tad secretion system protein [Marinobacter sp. HL-58]
MKTMTQSFVIFGLFAISGVVMAEDPDQSDDKPGGMIGLSFEADPRSDTEKVMDEQASKPVRGGELTQDIYVLTQERIAETFSRPIPDRISESTRDD